MTMTKMTMTMMERTKMKGLLQELNRIASEEMQSEFTFKYECLFCGTKSAKRSWMSKHIVSHLKQCMPVCEQCGELHIPDWLFDIEEILASHTETVVV